MRRSEMNKSEKKKWVDAAGKAIETGKWAEIMCKALGSRVARRWKFVSFRGKKEGEWRGIVDVLAIRKDTSKPSRKDLKRGDLFEMIIIQIKGGKAKAPSASDVRRLKLVDAHYLAKHIVLYQWEKRKNSQFKIWEDGDWKPKEAVEIFG
jgi:hypothetical protein